MRGFPVLIADRPTLAAAGLGNLIARPLASEHSVRRQPFAARHSRPRTVPSTGFQCVSGMSLASDDGRPREGRRAWRLSVRCAFCSPYSPAAGRSATAVVVEARAPARV